ncbi:MAG: hypothetical protein JWO38_4939 [Gemmataceae bacterium]|nr:hypothetical protein [Gemmataceae bacterium]
MHKRRWVLVLVVLLVAAAAYTGVRHQPPSGPPFAELDTLLATHYQNGWSVLVPPKREGPYRLATGEHPVVPRGSDKGINYRLRGPDGVEEVKLDSSAEYDQTLLELETRDGHRTLVVLKRSR